MPILIADKKQRVVGAVHAGWKGTALDVAGETIRRMRDAFDAKPDDCVAAIGPSICGECYEVSAEVVEEIGELELKGEWKLDDRHVDLSTANYELLERTGIPRGNIEALSHCTSCDPRFVSWRRDRSRGRQASFISLI